MEQISFTDSTFQYTFVQGLINGTVTGSFTQSGDTITINSKYQKDDYSIQQSLDTSLAPNSMEIRIKSIEFGEQVQVRHRRSEHHLTIYPGKIISHSRKDVFDETSDTIVQLFEIPITPKVKEIDVKVLRMNSKITIPVTEQFNAYFIDLTEYPNELDYIFFKNQKMVVRRDYLYFLTDSDKPETQYKEKVTRKGIKISKKKEIRKFMQCRK